MTPNSLFNPFEALIILGGVLIGSTKYNHMVVTFAYPISTVYRIITGDK